MSIATFEKNIAMSNLKLFESKKIRSHWDAEEEKWYFSVIDVIEILTGSSIPKRYWSDLKKKRPDYSGRQTKDSIFGGVLVGQRYYRII